jgi:hypothetical protein
VSSPKKFDGSFEGQSVSLAQWVAEMMAAHPQEAADLHSDLNQTQAYTLLQDLWSDVDQFQGPSKKIH